MHPSMSPPRAQKTDKKPKVLLPPTHKAPAHHRHALSLLAQPNMDVDNSVEGALQELLFSFDTFANHVVATGEWLNDHPEN